MSKTETVNQIVDHYFFETDKLLKESPMNKLQPETIRQRYREIKADRNDELLRTKTRYNQRLADLQKRCSHDWQFNSDPSGNNDSDYTCSNCRLTSRKML